MKNRYWVILIIFLIVIIGLGVYFSIKNNTNNQQAEYEANKTSSNSPNNTSENDTTQSNEENNEKNAEPNSNTENPDNPDNNTNQPVENSQNQSQGTPPTTEEVELASFSTKIYSSDTARQNNIQITCNTLNNTTVKSGTSFSFCTTVGKATSARGYQEADIYDNDGNKKKGLGGGNCQVSTTLYNAVAKVNGIKVTERHNHSNRVPYAKSGKDAAVAHRKL